MAKRKAQPMDRLSRESTAAIEAGMSYGQWKATHPYGLPDPDDEKPATPAKKPATRPPRYCKICGGLLPDKRRAYCSEECEDKGMRERNAASSRRYKERYSQLHPRPPIYCAHCGGLITERLRKKYCSSECEANARQQRRNAANNERAQMNREEAPACG